MVIAWLGASLYESGKTAIRLCQDAYGKMTMQVLAAVAEFERDLLIERTLSGQARAKTAGVVFGRPKALTYDQQVAVEARLAAGEAVAAVARAFKTSRQTIMRIRANDTRT